MILNDFCDLYEIKIIKKIIQNHSSDKRLVEPNFNIRRFQPADKKTKI